LLTRLSLRHALFSGLVSGIATLAFAASASAQVTPAAGYTPPDDTQSVKVGAVVFTDYTFQSSPSATDGDSNTISPNSFSVSRAYLNVTGNLSHVVNFRITTDVARETGSGSSLNGSYTVRLKYGFMQINLDDWMTKGSWVRIGLQQTPFIDFTEGVYRYRFQGATFTDKEGLLTSSDNGVSFHNNFKNNYGDFHVGLYNGEGYSKAEANNTKSVQVRFTVRPFAQGDPNMRGLRFTVFYDGDDYIQNDPKRRFVAETSYESAHAALNFDYAKAKDQTTATATQVNGQGWSVWFTPFFQQKGDGWEGLFRYDHYTPNTATATSNQAHEHTIVGLAYWFPHPGGNASAALLFDYDQYKFANFAVSSSTATQKKLAVHCLINF